MSTLTSLDRPLLSFDSFAPSTVSRMTVYFGSKDGPLSSCAAHFGSKTVDFWVDRPLSRDCPLWTWLKKFQKNFIDGWTFLCCRQYSSEKVFTPTDMRTSDTCPCHEVVPQPPTQHALPCSAGPCGKHAIWTPGPPFCWDAAIMSPVVWRRQTSKLPPL